MVERKVQIGTVLRFTTNFSQNFIDSYFFRLDGELGWRWFFTIQLYESQDNKAIRVDELFWLFHFFYLVCWPYRCPPYAFLFTRRLTFHLTRIFQHSILPGTTGKNPLCSIFNRIRRHFPSWSHRQGGWEWTKMARMDVFRQWMVKSTLEYRWLGKQKLTNVIERTKQPRASSQVLLS